ncbi:MAG: hypothetical protein JXD23_00980 [Spirochaetales bacterium]|nr:hypothetical protein [Spirochaetales bacterium]
MDKNILDWLLEGPPWLRFAVEKQLLGINPKAGPAAADDSMKRLLSGLKGNQGLFTLKTGKISYKAKMYWELFFLADIGFTIKDVSLEKEAESIYGLQSPDGKFVTMEGMKPDYFCIPAILLTALKKMEFDDRGRLDRFIDLVLDSQRLDGGWHCAAQRAKGGKLEDSESCPMDNQNILMLLGQFDEYRNDPRFKGAVDLILGHWDKRGEKRRPYGFGIGTDFRKLKYPAVTYGILRVLDALSLFPYAGKSKSFKSMLGEVRSKAKSGRYCAESIVKAFSDFDFGQKSEPSRWITFIVNRIEKRIDEA